MSNETEHELIDVPANMRAWDMSDGVPVKLDDLRASEEMFMQAGFQQIIELVGCDGVEFEAVLIRQDGFLSFDITDNISGTRITARQEVVQQTPPTIN